MTAYLAGLAQTRCEEHPSAAQIDLTMRAVLSAMAYPAKEEDPRCYASQSRIARKAGCDRTVVHRALKRLADLGLIERVEARVGVPVHFRLTILAGPKPVAESNRSTDGNLLPRATGPVVESNRGCSGEQHDPSESSGALAKEDEEEPATADSADAPSSAAAGGPSSDALAEIARRDDVSIEHTQRWAAAVLADRTVDNPDAYLRGCQRRGDGPGHWKPRTKAAKAPATDRIDNVRSTDVVDVHGVDNPSSAGVVGVEAADPEQEKTDRIGWARLVVAGDLTAEDLIEDNVASSAEEVSWWIEELRDAVVDRVVDEDATIEQIRNELTSIDDSGRVSPMADEWYAEGVQVRIEYGLDGAA